MENAARLVTINEYAMNSRYCPNLTGSSMRTSKIGLKNTSAKLVMRANARIRVDVIRCDKS